MFVLKCIFAVVGLSWFGDPDTGDGEHWGDLGSAFITLFGFLEGWADLQQRLDELEMSNSHAFTIVFILIGNFIFFDVFAAIDIEEIHHTMKNLAQNAYIESRSVSLSLSLCNSHGT